MTTSNPYTPDAFADVVKRLEAAAELLPPGALKSAVLTRMTEVRPWVRLAKRHAATVQQVLSAREPSGIFVRSPIEDAIDQPIRAQRILRGIVSTLATGTDHLRTPPMLLLLHLHKQGPMPTDQLAKVKPRWSDGPMCESDFTIALRTLKDVGVIAYDFANSKPGEPTNIYVTDSPIAKGLLAVLDNPATMQRAA